MRMSIRRSWQPHWTIVGICLAVVSLTTTAAVLSEPGGHGSSATVVGAKPSGSTSASASASSSGTAAAGGTTAHTLDFGIAYGNTLFEASKSAVDAGLNDAVSVGAKWIRVDLPWSSIQPDDAYSYNWSGFDTIATEAKARGLHIDAVLDDVPRWARSSSCVGYFSCPPGDPDTFAAFAAAAAHRYSAQGVRTWEVWNEPNLVSWWPQANPPAYEALLAVTSKALRKAEPNAYVILGGLAAVPTDAAKKYMSAYDFLTKVAALGGTKYVDAVGFHPYSEPTMPSAAPTFQDISDSSHNLVSVLQRYSTPNVSIWLTETGAPVQIAAQDPTATQSATKQMESLQTTYATNLVSTVSANTHVGADFWYSDQDDPKNGLYFGLRRANGSLRSAFYALKDAIAVCSCQTAG
jgi:hypothetical protein